MTKRSILLVIAAVIFAAVIAVGGTFAWFVYFRNSLIVVSGDAEIGVRGFFDVVTGLDDRDFDREGGEMDGEVNEFKDMQVNQFITYKFEITNYSERAAYLSVRLSNMFNSIFAGLDEYMSSGGVNLPDLKPLATQNNGRVAVLLDYIYFEYENSGGEIVDEDGRIITTREINYINRSDDMYIWKYSRDDLIIGNSGEQPLHQKINKIFLPSKDKNIKTNLYMSLISKQDVVATDNYKQWLCGSEQSVGVGQEYGANKLGYTWAGLKASGDAHKADYIDRYLTKYVQDEIASIIPEDIGGAVINLNIKYFEFIGENASE